ncbi:hypothetical protein Pmar_PMAR013458 [Perkinsus marinus ATCC 50983]|uniref:Uncharacterized protein n=1 Tax=Perkinsus marinus (strain ATCC 50983 / TXsc) TaxID=423536 RepID=C5KLW2_PERM5|nr:hypothetical protein Pmar_PMAR004251 [Perkinsus marinus ATCC 50983]XP_002782736.1 hypothetical protein Pmar_PMAR013458 [Perkinsus marinus ATCC 50983]EER01800.1 hypothetical protein Pmar_PMAR004251 [Perkinsus marinus ATCC 50983]EER14531.1 hypothetical protein Pmar_PMAR013458 [Perkinsus marinus ATCC 50983]|eukprot:XP_002769082.1 hypothetical protein Pmar_PMAR004251 [Perkinsus marinus ATCC 50983]
MTFFYWIVILRLTVCGGIDFDKILEESGGYDKSEDPIFGTESPVEKTSEPGFVSTPQWTTPVSSEEPIVDREPVPNVQDQEEARNDTNSLPQDLRTIIALLVVVVTILFLLIITVVWRSMTQHWQYGNLKGMGKGCQTQDDEGRSDDAGQLSEATV